MHKIAIIGGGIAGTSCALALALAQARTATDKRTQIHLFERSTDWREFGGGIQLAPNAVHVLDHWGLSAALRARAFMPHRAQILEGLSDRTLFSAPLGSVAAARYQADYLHILRGDLLGVLADAIQKLPVHCHLGCEVVALSPARFSTQGAELSWRPRGSSGSASDPKPAVQTESFDLVILADGIHSTLLHTLALELPTIRASGLVAWRGLIDVDATIQRLVAPAANVWIGPHQHFVGYYVDGGRKISFVAVLEDRARHFAKDGRVEPSAGSADWQAGVGSPNELPRDSLSKDSDALALTHLRDAFAGWAEPVRIILAQASHCAPWPLPVRPVLKRFHHANIVAVGDAAHAMPPFMAQGAAMAIEDAAILARLISDNPLGPIAPALVRFTDLRLARVKRVSAQSWSNRRLFHAQGRDRAWQRLKLTVASQLPAVHRLAPLDWLYGYKAFG